jgi:pimeloyl-ACP methyl ester carboxylesterase
VTTIEGIYVTEWGTGPRVLFIHGGTPGGGAAAFSHQEPLKERWHLVLPDRPAHGQSPRQGDEDFERDAQLLAPLLEPGTHLVGQSYGGMVALYMAATRPDLVASLVLIEAPAFSLAPDDPVVSDMASRNRALFKNPPEDPVLMMRLVFEMLGIGLQIPDPAPEFFVDIAKGFAESAVQIRPPDEATIDASILASAGFPVLALTSGNIPGFEHIAAAIVAQIGGTHVVVPNTDHSVQDAGEPVNAMLESLWLSASTSNVVSSA